MQTFHSYGKIGLGDLVASTSFLFTHELREDSHIIFHIPKIKYDCTGYEQQRQQNYSNAGSSRITAVLDLLENPLYTLTYEFDDSDIVARDINYIRPSTVASIHQSFDHYMKLPNKNQYKFIFRHETRCTEHLYWPSKKQWEANLNGPIGIYLNHELEVGPKFFNEQDNIFLHSLIDNQNYFSLGQPRTFEENIDIMSKCRYIIGNEGGWTHVSHSMRVPYIICANQRPINEIKKFHSKHPNLQIIDTKNMRDFLVL